MDTQTTSSGETPQQPETQVFDPSFIERIMKIYPTAKYIHELLEQGSPRALRALQLLYHTRERTIQGAERTLGCPDLVKALPHDKARLQAEVALMFVAQEEARAYFPKAAKKFGYSLHI